MSQAFLNGYRASHNMGMGNVRTPQMRSMDQRAGFSGNPGTAYNMPQMNTGAIASPAQQMQALPQDMLAQQQAMQGMPPQAQGFSGMQPGMGNAISGYNGGQVMPSKPMRARMPIMNQPGQLGLQVQQMPVQTRPPRAQYARPALASINNEGRRVYSL